MKYEEFDKLLHGVNRLSNITIRDEWSPIPRGYNILGREGYLLLISADGATNVYFDRWQEMIRDKAVALYLGEKEVGAIGIDFMEVVE